jgi:hypothetical protein
VTYPLPPFNNPNLPRYLTLPLNKYPLFLYTRLRLSLVGWVDFGKREELGVDLVLDLVSGENKVKGQGDLRRWFPG